MTKFNTFSRTLIYSIILFLTISIAKTFSQNKFPNKPEDYTSILVVAGTAEGVNLKYKNPYGDTLWTTYAGTFNGTINSQPEKFYCIDLQNYLAFNQNYWDEGYTQSEVTYILNNYWPYKTSYPGKLSNNSYEAAAVQMAIWHFTDGVDPNTITNNETVKTRALQIISDALANHNNIKPIETPVILLTSKQFPTGMPVQFYVYAFDIDGNPIPNVTIKLSTTLGTLDLDSVITNTNGEGGPITLTYSGEGTAVLSARADVVIPQGTKYVHTVSPNSKQKIVLATPTFDLKEVQDTISWFTPEPCDLSGYVTYTQGGWGSPSNSRPGKLRDLYFNTVFPSGLVVGSNYTLTLTNAAAVMNFLPQGGTTGAFNMNYVDPISTSAGVLGGQIVALKLNVMFNAAGYLGTNPVLLGDLVIKTGPFTGWTVNQFLAFAEQAIGGGALNGYTFDQINETAMAINENFDNGNVNYGFLDCPENVYGKIGDFVWSDSNENGLQDPDENGIPGVVVKLFTCENVLVDSTVTDNQGKYQFINVIPGSYYVMFELPEGYQFTEANQGSDDALDSDVDVMTGKTECFTLSHGENKTDVDAGLYLMKASLGDWVWNDFNENGIQEEDGEEGVPGIIVKLYDCMDNLIATTVTDSMGYYLFNNLTPGNYYIKFEIPAEFKFSAQDQGDDDNLDSDVDSLTGKTTCVLLQPGESNLSLDAGISVKRGSIGDFVWNDLNMDGIQDENENGFADIIVYLYDCDGNLIDSTRTDSLGFYSFNNLMPGTYKIKVILPIDYQFTLANQGSNDNLDSDIDPSTGFSHCFELAAGQNRTDVDAGMHLIPPPPTCSVGDKVWEDLNKNGIQDYGEPGVPFVTVKLLTCDGIIVSETQTNNNGFYNFPDVVSGIYKLRFILPSGYAFSLKDVGLNDLLDSDVDPLSGLTECFPIDPTYCDSNSTRWDAGIYRLKSSIGDFVWFDQNQNGIQDNGETGVKDILVKLYDCDNNLISVTTTNDQGYYLFENLDSGNYYLQFNAPTGFLFTVKDQGTDDTKDSDVDPATGKTECFNLAAGIDDRKWDAGLSACATGVKISGMVYNDANGNGQLDPGEVGIENVVIKLWGTYANLIAQTMTDELGRFEFNYVLDGEYHVQEIDPPGFISTTPNSNFIIVSGSDITGILFGDKEKPVQEPCDLTLYKTYTQDQWCLEPAKSLLETKFTDVFGTSMVIGDQGSSYQATFTNANAVKIFLPQIGPVGQFTTNYVNPTTTSAGEFAGNVAALTLNVAFNDAGYLGSTSTTKLGNLVVASGPMKDYKVYEVLMLANKALGGGTTPFSLDVLNSTVEMINYNFACDCNYGFLTCPPPPDTCGGGYDAGVESNANLADLLLQRLTKIEYGMTTKILRNPKVPFTASFGLYEILPQYGPLGSRAKESTPFDILGISNATSAYAVDYNLKLTKGDVRIASVFATTTNPPYVYEHTKAICDRLVNAELKSLTQIKIGENYYFASVIDKPEEGVTDYTIHFSVYEIGTKFIVDSRWLIEEYRVPSGVTNIYNFQVWGSNFKNAMYLVSQIIDQFKQRGTVEFMNRASLSIPVTYVQKGRYLHNGNVELLINNTKNSNEDLTIVVKSRKVQGGERSEELYQYSLTKGLNSLNIKTGILSDANIYVISSNGFKDEIFVSGGAYTYLNGQNSTVDNFDTKGFAPQDVNAYPEGSLVLAGGARVQGKLRDWVTIFRSLTANTAPIDLSDYESIKFTINGNGKVWLRIEQDGVENFNFHSKQIILNGKEQTLTIPFSEFAQRKGVSTPLDPSKVRKISLVMEKSDNMSVENYDLEIKNIAFLSKSESKESNKVEIPKEYTLSQNYPNPFNPSTMIEFAIVKPEFVTLKVYNILGQEVATLVNEVKAPGIYSVRFDASNLSSGVYIYKLQTESFTATKKMILQK